jgi:hypothetical protein
MTRAGRSAGKEMTMSTPEDRTPPQEKPQARAPSAGRQRQRRRIVRATRALAVGGVAATAAFALAAAHSGSRSATTSTSQGSSSADGDTTRVPLTSLDDLATDDGYESGEWEDDGSAVAPIAPSQSAPTPSLAPPVVQSGGS